MSFGFLADLASLVALALSMVALWRSFTIARRLVEQDQQTMLFLNFKRNERILRQWAADPAEGSRLEFLATLERCKVDAQTLSRLRYSKTRPDAIRLGYRIRRFEILAGLARRLGATDWQTRVDMDVSVAVAHFTRKLENEERRQQLEKRYAGQK